MDGQGIETSLPLPEFKEGEPKLMGIFLVGAYQEILGDMHNLFGDTDSVHVELDDDGGFHFIEAIPGDSVADVLRYVHFEPDNLRDSYQSKIDAADLAPAQKDAYLKELEENLKGTTYLEL